MPSTVTVSVAGRVSAAQADRLRLQAERSGTTLSKAVGAAITRGLTQPGRAAEEESGLTESGFSREEALALTRDYLLATIQAGHAQLRRDQE